jgi:hypothetical protein
MTAAHTGGRSLHGLIRHSVSPPPVHVRGCSVAERRHAPAGAGALSGDTVIAGLPDTPVSREVELVDLALVPARRRQWSSEAGAVHFSGLPIGRRYLMVAYDHTGAYDPVAKFVTVPIPE